MNTVPKSWVWAAAAVLFVVALGSLMLSAVRSGASRDTVSDPSTLTPVPTTTPATALTEPEVTEARVREIAREEAQAQLNRVARPKPVAKDDAADGADAGTTAARAAAATGAPAAARPTTPAATRPAQTQPPAQPIPF
jgi:hypothetical protein